MRPIFNRFHSVGGSLVGGSLVGAPFVMPMQSFMSNPALAAQAVQQVPLAAQQGAPYLANPGPATARVQTLGFPSTTVATTASATISSAPQVWFRPDRLFISSAIAKFFTVTSLLVGNKSQLLNGNPLTAVMFSELAVDSAISYDTCDPAVTISLGVTNNDTVTQTIVPSMLGRSAY